MSPTEFEGNSYEIIAWALDQEVIYYASFGDYQGEWVMVSRSSDHYYIWKGWFGSCSGCDAFQDEEPSTKQEAIKFAEDYHPFLEIPIDTAKEVCRQRKLIELWPANMRDSMEIFVEEACTDAQTRIKLRENISIVVDDVLETSNAEIQRMALDSIGHDRFMELANPEILDKRGTDSLIKVGEMYLLSLKDSSTPRRYLLRVPPAIRTVSGGVAWTFDMTEQEYQPLIET